MSSHRKIPDRNSIISYVPLGKMFVSLQAQRTLRPAWVKEIAANFNIDSFGIPVLNFRDPNYYIVDAQHRIFALREWLGEGWETQEIECEVHVGLNEQKEAEMFLKLNKNLNTNPFEKFKISITAKRYIEIQVKKTVEEQGLLVSNTRSPGSVGAVSTLIKVYNRSGVFILGRSLRIIRDSFGDSGFEAKIIDGIALVCQRYNGAVDEQLVVKKLSGMRGGMTGLTNKAFVIKKSTGYPMASCIAAATVETVNSGRGGRKLSPWWKIAEIK